jgi:hypothetical protein
MQHGDKVAIVTGAFTSTGCLSDFRNHRLIVAVARSMPRSITPCSTATQRSHAMRRGHTEEPDSAGAAERCGRLLLELEQPLLILPTQQQREAGVHQHL